ncbi:MAG: peptidase MA family metallohydrolase [Gemmatimonadetes bacterium]|nr:peptidase MA family metallohydrolase [Gemmatimonadota bacterium]
MRFDRVPVRVSSYLRSWCLGWACSVLVLLPGPGAGAEESVRTDHGVRVTFEPADAPFVDHVLDIVREASPDLRATLGLPSADTIHIHIAPTQEAFLTYTPGAIPEWGAGYAVPHRRLVVLRSPRITGTYDGSEELVVHELAHVMLHSALRGADIPRWLDEGFAMHMARDWGFWDRASLVVAVVSGNLVPLSAIQGVNRFPEHRAHLAYQQSALAVQYILRMYGEAGLHTLFDSLRRTGSIDRASFETFGMSVVEFERDWLAFMERNYGWRMLLGESLSLVIAPLFGVLCLLAFLQIRRRRRATLRRWASEEVGDWRTDEDDWRRKNEEWVMSRERDE